MNPELTPYETEEVQTLNAFGLRLKVRLTFKHVPDPPLAQTCVTHLSNVEILEAQWRWYSDECDEFCELTSYEVSAINFYLACTATPKT